MIARGRIRRGAIACVSMTIALLAGCDWMPGRPTEAEMPLRPSAITDFGQLYGENCVGCHGADGKLGPAIALNNPVYLAIVDDASMRRVIANGTAGTAMPPFLRAQGGTLTDQQIDLLVAGIRKKWSGDSNAGAGTPPYASNAAGDPNRGARVYAANCQSCHGPDGKGAAAGSIIDASFLALVSDQNLRATIIAGRPDLGHPDWKGYPAGQALNSQQVSDVVAWMASKRPASQLSASNAAIH
ncbi:MAG: cytochrome c [Candidatus Binatus sp.]|uniref:cytochrome c n=1 Tax=Candidatus Binatus sp. TaxID=2811406 RepID=UPI00271A1B37|nr:cytochrome c [Candidatus Binatus sp.]MDO8432388.1 cytochrome c [Candidatus Binatus sp.]